MLWCSLPRRRMASSGSVAPPTCTQAARRSVAAARSSGSSVMQLSSATGQRGWNVQPEGSADGSGGSPGRPRGANRDAASPIRGNAADRAFPYGCCAFS